MISGRRGELRTAAGKHTKHAHKQTEQGHECASIAEIGHRFSGERTHVWLGAGCPSVQVHVVSKDHMRPCKIKGRCFQRMKVSLEDYGT